jgi:2-oxoglutarate ferredoxin oxidoreductase subunit alpha
MERVFIQGNEAVGEAALTAGCHAFFGYPITPQNETFEWFAQKFPKMGRAFVQAQSEVGAINMVYGAAATGKRVITSTSGPGWGLMQEGIANLCAAELPCVIVLVQRGGTPGAPSVQHAQADYLSATRGGGGSGYRNIVLAPASVQETYDLVQLAFYLADKYRNPVVILSDALIGHLMEPLELRELKFDSLPEKEWAVRGKGQQNDKKRRYVTFAAVVQGREPYPTMMSFAKHWYDKVEKMKSEVRVEMTQQDDCKLWVVAYGYTSRVSKEAVNEARAQGLGVGFIRPITLWPFPEKAISEAIEKGAEKFLVIEDNIEGQMIEDVRNASQGEAEVHHLGLFARHLPTPAGMILPHTVFEEMKRLL